MSWGNQCLSVCDTQDATGSIPIHRYFWCAVMIDPKALGVHHDMRLRLVVRAWRSETNLIDKTRPIRKDSFSLTSASFLWDEKPSK